MTADHFTLLTLALTALSLPSLARRALCRLDHSGLGTVSGTITILQHSRTTQGRISGLAPGQHGFHVHEVGDLGEECKAAGGHFNPFKKDHGGGRDRERHVGDLGNIEASARGEAVIDIKDRLAVLDGPTSILGRAIVIHSGQDDLGRGGDSGSLKTGNAGSRLACCVIRETVPVFSVKYLMSLLSNWNIRK